MILIPLEQIPNQEFEIILNNQDCTIHLFLRGDYLYLDLMLDNESVFYGAICYDRTKILPVNSIFKGNFIFIDNLGRHKPEYEKLNERYKLYYLTSDEVIEFDTLLFASDSEESKTRSMWSVYEF